jgi:uncharacterized Zn finger protein
MVCSETGQEVEPEVIRSGIIRCPACGSVMNEETLEEV